MSRRTPRICLHGRVYCGGCSCGGDERKQSETGPKEARIRSTRSGRDEDNAGTDQGREPAVLMLLSNGTGIGLGRKKKVRYACKFYPAFSKLQKPAVYVFKRVHLVITDP